MSRPNSSKRHHRPSRSGWAVLALAVIFSVSIGTAVHNHGLFGSNSGAEKVSQSSFTCPACVFDGKPVTTTVVVTVVCDSKTITLEREVERSYERILEETSSARAPPAV